MKKSKLGITSFIISLFPFITLIFSILKMEIDTNVQTGLVAFNIISIITAFALSIVQVKNKEKREIFSILSLCISTFLGLLMIGITVFGLLATFG